MIPHLLELALLLTGPTYAQSPSHGSASGQFHGEDSLPVAELTVRLSREPTVTKVRTSLGQVYVRPTEASVIAFTKTNGGGIFVSDALPAGRYSLCLDTPGFVDPCHWDVTPVFEIRAGNATVLPLVTVKKGTHISVSVTDPSHMIQNLSATAPGVVVGVYDNKRVFHPASSVSTLGSSLVFQMTIPQANTYDLWIHGGRYILRDETSSVISRLGQRYKLGNLSGQKAVSRSFTVVGRL